jgi:hypothetical protein
MGREAATDRSHLRIQSRDATEQLGSALVKRSARVGGRRASDGTLKQGDTPLSLKLLECRAQIWLATSNTSAAARQRALDDGTDGRYASLRHGKPR